MVVVLTDSWARELLALAIVLVLGSLASGAGVGGGALYIPLFILLLTPAKLAIPLSKACAFGASVALFIINAPRSRPGATGNGRRPLIDYRMAVMLEPFTLIGTIAGVRLNKLLPFPILAILMAVILTLVALKTCQKAMMIHRKEQLLSTASSDPGLLEDLIVADEPSDAVRQLMERESAQYPVWPIMTLVFYWVLGVLPSMIVSNKSFGIQCLSPTYVSVMLLSILVISVCAIIYAVLETRFEKVRQRALYSAKYESSEETQFTPYNVVLLSSVSLLAGLLSALVGVGGSTIKGPFLQHIARPDVASATAAFMLLSTCSASMFQFILIDMLDWSQAGLFIVAGFVAAFFGARMWNYLISVYNKRSMIVFLLGGYVSLATIVMTALSIYEIRSHKSFGNFENIC